MDWLSQTSPERGDNPKDICQYTEYNIHPKGIYLFITFGTHLEYSSSFFHQILIQTMFLTDFVSISQQMTVQQTMKTFYVLPSIPIRMPGPVDLCKSTSDI